MSAFQGFPEAALDFYDDLELDNTKSFWEAHKKVWNDAVKVPMTDLTDALAEEFGSAKIFRPYREDWFSSHTTIAEPYKPADPCVHAASGNDLRNPTPRR